jgi:hypothetical protein
VLLLSTATAGFHDLSALRRREASGERSI